MNDFKEIWESFIQSVSNHKNLKDLIKKLENGKATYEDAQEYSSSFANYLVSYLSAENPTNAEQVLEILKNTTICKNFFSEIDDYTYSMQKALNEVNQIGLNAVKVTSPRQLIDSDILLSNDYEKDIVNMANKAELTANKHIDTVQQANAKFQSNAGYEITVSRTYDGKGLSDGRTCKWCLSRVGHNIPYDEAYKKGMFQRHEGCHCIIEYNKNGTEIYQSAKGGSDSWTDSMGYKKQFEINEGKNETKNFQTYESKYTGIYTQTYSTNAQDMIEFLNENVKASNKYGELDEMIVVKNSSLNNLAGYDQETNRLYISEELANSKKFNLLVNKEYFPSENINDIINHELGGHKAHWDSVKRYAEDTGLDLYEAKQKLEENIRKYVKQQVAQDRTYIQKTISLNAYDAFTKRDLQNKAHDELLRKNSINELIADAKVLIDKNKLSDKKLEELVKEVIYYDVRTN